MQPSTVGKTWTYSQLFFDISISCYALWMYVHNEEKLNENIRISVGFSYISLNEKCCRFENTNIYMASYEWNIYWDKCESGKSQNFALFHVNIYYLVTFNKWAGFCFFRDNNNCFWLLKNTHRSIYFILIPLDCILQ